MCPCSIAGQMALLSGPVSEQLHRALFHCDSPCMLVHMCLRYTDLW